MGLERGDYKLCGRGTFFSHAVFPSWVKIFVLLLQWTWEMYPPRITHDFSWVQPVLPFALLLLIMCCWILTRRTNDNVHTWPVLYVSAGYLRNQQNKFVFWNQTLAEENLRGIRQIQHTAALSLESHHVLYSPVFAVCEIGNFSRWENMSMLSLCDVLSAWSLGLKLRVEWLV